MPSNSNSNSNSNTHQQRLSLKQASDVATRQSMQERRQEWTNRIRKTKKSHILSLKRKFYDTSSSSSAAATTTTTNQINLQNGTLSQSSENLPITIKLIDIANAFLKDPKNEACLVTLKNALAKEQSQLFLQPDALSDPHVFVSALADALSIDSLKLPAAQVLTNLAATEPPPQPLDTSYYGSQPLSWCSAICESNALQSLYHILTNETNPEVVQQSCWALGNLAGDSQASRDKLLSLQFISPLVHVCKAALHHSSPSLLRNAAWALSNLARGVTTTAAPFCGPSLLTPDILSQMVLSPEHFPVITNTNTVSWWDVAQEAMWIVAYLTAKEDQVVGYLCESMGDNLSFSTRANSTIRLCEAVASRLEQAVKVIKHQESFTSEKAQKAIRMVIPCIRSVGNIATASDGQYLEALLGAHDKSITFSLAALIEMGSFPSSTSHTDIATIATEAAWASGALLCDAGLEHHISTEVAAPALIPKLCACVHSGYAKLDLQREVLTALWNCSAAPPRADTQTMGAVWSTRGIRDGFLMEMLNSHPNMIRSLVDLLVSVDMDVVLYSLQLVNGMLRRLGDTSTVNQRFRSVQGVEALEAICDQASATSHYGDMWQGGNTSAADIAADLIDDLFPDDDDLTETNHDMSDVTPTATGDTFVFGLQPQRQAQFSFGLSPRQDNLGGFGNGAPRVVAGRGRGKPVPAWMQRP